MESIKIFQDSIHDLIKKADISFTNDSYIVSINDKIIGFFNAHIRQNDMMIDYELLEEYRGIGLGNYFLSIIEDYLSTNFEFDRFLLIIRYDNEKSKKVALKNNYSIDYDISEEMSIDGEMTMYTPYMKTNEKNDKKTLK